MLVSFDPVARRRGGGVNLRPDSEKGSIELNSLSPFAVVRPGREGRSLAVPIERVPRIGSQGGPQPP